MEGRELQIVLVGPYTRTDRPSSMEYYLAMMQRELEARGITVFKLAPQPRWGKTRVGVQLLSKLLAAVDKLLLFPRELKRRVRELERVGPVCVHIVDHAYANYSTALRRIPHLVTVHDLLTLQATRGLVPNRKESRGTYWYQTLLLYGLRKARCLVAVSETTRGVLSEITGIPREEIFLNYNGLHFPYVRIPEAEARLLLNAEFEKRGRGGFPFFLHVGINIWYRNREGVIRIFAKILEQNPGFEHRLLMVGPPLTEEMRQLCRDLEVDDRVMEFSGVPNETLQAIYRLADGLIFPSYHEGFGWPIAEAQKCGCPVFTTGKPPMTEVGGAAAIYFDPDDIDGAAIRIADALPLKEELSQKSIENAARFETQKMVDNYLAIYRELQSPSVTTR